MEQAFVYKGDKAELHDKDVADRMKADEGWHDNPTDAKSTGEPEVNGEPDSVAPKPVTVEVAEGPKKRGPKPKLSLSPATAEDTASEPEG